MTDDVTVTAAEAAEQVGVSRAAIDQWVHRGHLAPIPGPRPRRFRLADVFAAEAARMRSMRRPNHRDKLASDS